MTARAPNLPVTLPPTNVPTIDPEEIAFDGALVPARSGPCLDSAPPARDH